MKASAAVLLLLISPPVCAQLLPVDNTWVKQTLNGMSLEEKIGQLLKLYIKILRKVIDNADTKSYGILYGP